jgi:hypothetical protein
VLFHIFKRAKNVNGGLLPTPPSFFFPCTRCVWVVVWCVIYVLGVCGWMCGVCSLCTRCVWVDVSCLTYVLFVCVFVLSVFVLG